jgi:hypothetical protein
MPSISLMEMGIKKWLFRDFGMLPSAASPKSCTPNGQRKFRQ